MNGLVRLIHRDFIRSIRGQLALLGLTYAGAVALAVVALFFRTGFFEYHVRESYPEPSSRILETIEEAARASGVAAAPERLNELERTTVYGAWINDPAIDPTGRAALRLLWTNPDDTIRRLRITFVTGNLAQRTRGLELLPHAKPEVHDQAIALCRYLGERARRRGEWDLAGKAERVFNQLQVQPTS
jgi:hypothetical protein